MHDQRDGETVNEFSVLVIFEVNGRLQLDLFDVAFAVAHSVGLVSFLGYDRSADRGVDDDCSTRTRSRNGTARRSGARPHGDWVDWQPVWGGLIRHETRNV